MDLFTLAVREQIARAKFTVEEKLSEILAIKDEIDRQVDELIARGSTDLLSATVETTS